MTDSVSEQAGGLLKKRRVLTNAATNGGMDRLPPHATEAEQGLLGCALLIPNLVLPGLIEGRFSPMWNYDLRHQTIGQALLRVFERGEPVDVISVQQELKKLEMLEQVGGIPYLNELQDSTPTGMNWAYYRDVIKEKWKLRKMLHFCGSVRERVYDFTGTVDQLLTEFESDVEQLCAPLTDTHERHIKAVINEQVIPSIERHYSRGSTQLDGLPTGPDWYLDKVLLGIAPTDYVILSARPGEGKTSLALNIVDHLATKHVHWEEVTEAGYNGLPTDQRSNPEAGKFFQRQQGIPIGVFTLEMTEESLGFRLVFSHAQVSSGSFRQGFASETDFAGVHRAAVELGKANIYLDGEADQSMDMIAAKARRMARQHGIKLFVLDYLQLLDSDADSDRLRVLRRISKKIVSLKKRLQIPWLVLVQMNRNIETSERARRPVLSDLKESGSLEQDADKIIFLYHPLKSEGIEEDEEKIEQVLTARYGDKPIPWDAWPRRINALVAKNRNGPTGPATLLFQNNQCLFHDWRQWQLTHGLAEKAAGEREPLPTNEEMGFPPPPATQDEGDA